MQQWETLKNRIQAWLNPSQDDTAQEATERPRSAVLLLLFIPLMCMAMFCASQIAFLLSVPGNIPQRIAALATANYSAWEYEQFQIISPRIETEVFLDQPPLGNPITETQIASTTENQNIISTVFTATPTEGLVVRPFTTLTATETATSSLSATPTEILSATTTPTSSETATTTLTPSITTTFTETLTPMVTFTPSITPTETETATPTETQTLTPTATPTPTTGAPFVAAPSANFTVVTSGLSVTVSNTSSGSITSYNWSYGDGFGTRTGSNPSIYTYSAGGTYTIRLTVTGAGGSDTFSVTVNLSTPSTDLSMALASSNTSPQAGQTFTVTARISNLTGTAASGVAANVSFGSGLTYQSFTGSGSFDGSRWTVGTVAANSTVSITMTVRADTAGTSPTISASLASVTPADSNASNNNASVTINIQAVPVTSVDLAMSMTTSASNLILGDTFTYSLTVTNNGTIGATNVVISQTLPTGIAFVSSADCTASGQTVTCAVGALGAGSSQTVTVQAQANQTGTLSSSASASATQTDSNTANDTASASVKVSNEADLTLAMGVSSTTPPEQGTVTYDVTLTNNGPATATNIGINVSLPSGVTFVLASPASGTYASATGRWTVNSLASGASTVLNLTASVNTGTSGTTLTASSATATLTETDPTPASSSVDITPTATAVTINLNTTLSGTTGSVTAPRNLTYTATITNQGGGTATNVTALLTLSPSSLSVSSSSGNGTFDTATNTWTIGTLVPGQSVTHSFTFNVPTTLRGQTVTTEVSLASFDQADSDTTNNADSATVSIFDPGLSLTKSRNIGSPTIGQTVTYTVALRNQSAFDYTSVVVTDNLPAGVTFVSYTADQGTYNNSTGLWDVGTITTGATLNLRINVTVNADQAGNSIVNTASVTSETPADTYMSNHSDSATINVQTDALTLSKSASSTSLTIGQNVTYTVTVNNTDAIDYTGVIVEDNLPAGVTFVSYTADQGTYDETTGDWDVGTITANTTLSLRVVVSINLDQAGQSITNTATITAQSPTDPTPANNTDSATVNVRGRLSLDKSRLSGSASPQEGAQVTYRINLRSYDVIDYTGVIVTDNLPTGVTYISHVASQGTYDNTTGEWDIGTLTAGSSLTLDITVRVDDGTAGTTIDNIATITQTIPTAPPDSDLVGNEVIRPVAGILSLNKGLSSGSTTPEEGSQITYRLILRNDDFSDYSNVIVTDNLPAGVTYVSHTASQGTYDNTTGEWDVGNLPRDTQLTLTITVTVNNGTAGTTITNTASITSTTPTAPADADLVDSQAINPVATGVNVSLNVSDGTSPSASAYDVGDIVTVQVQLTNAGPQTATNVVVTASAIPDFTYLSTSGLPSGATYDSATRTLTIPSISNGQTLTANINFIVDASAGGKTINASANITAVDQTNSSTDLADTQSYVINGTDLAVSKSVSDMMPFEGQAVTYTVTVSNTGQDTTAVEVTDQLPIGVTYVSHTTATGTYDNVTGVWAVGDMTTGTSAQLDIVASVDVGTAGGTVTNTADITNFTQYEIDLTNNSASVGINPQGGTVDLALSKASSTNSVVLTDTFDYTITVTNNGTLPATSVEITDTLPTEVTFVSSASCTHNTGIVTCTVGTLVAGASQAVIINVEASAVGDPVTNSASVTLTETDADTSNNAASVDVTIAPQDLNAVSLCSPDPTTFQRWRVDNPNPFVINFDWDIFGSIETGSNTVPAASGGTPGQVVFTTQTQPSNTLIVSVGGVQNDTVASGLVTCDIDLGISLAVDDAAPYAGQTVQYTLTLTNNNPTHTASNIVVDVLLPLGATIEGNTPSVGTWTAPQWTVNTLAAGTSATLVLDVTVTGNDSDTLTTSASISSAQQPDVNTANNTATSDVTITQFTEDLAMTAFIYDPTPILDGNMTAIDITVENLSATTDIPNVSVPNLVPADLSYDSTVTITAGTFDSVTNVWSVGTLTAGGTASLRILVSDNTPNNTVTTTLTVNSVSNDDPTPANNSLSATLTIAPLLPDIVVSKTAPATINNGVAFDFTIDVQNMGTVDATNVSLEDVLPSNMLFVSASAVQASTNCTESSGTVTCDIGTLTVGETDTITIRVLPTLSNPTMAETVTNTANVTLTETDAAPSDNSSSVTVTVQP